MGKAIFIRKDENIMRKRKGKTVVKKGMNLLDKKVIGLQNMLVAKSSGMGTVEIILIIVCLVGIVLIFKSQITDLVESIFSKITSQAGKV